MFHTIMSVMTGKENDGDEKLCIKRQYTFVT